MPTRPRTLPAPLLARLTAGDATAVPQAAELLAAAARVKAAPRKSLAKALQHLARSSVGAGTCALVEEAAQRLLPAPETQRATGAAGGTCSTAEAAALAGIPPERFVKLLHEPHYRRLFGWPLWTGYEWRFVRAAVDPATSRSYLATMPEAEPAPIAATLPPWCRRETPDEAATTAVTREVPAPSAPVTPVGALERSTGLSTPAVPPLRRVVSPART